MSFSANEEVFLNIWTQISLVLVGTVVFTYLLQRLFRQLKKSIHRKAVLKTFFGTCETFVKYTTPLFGLLLAFYLLAKHFSYEPLAQLILSLGKVFAVVALAMALFKWKKHAETHLLETTHKDKSLIFALSRLLSIVIVVFSALFLLELFNYTPSTLLAFGGLGGLAVSFAAKDIIANFFGGLMIHVNRHFSVGDWIRSPNKNFEGIVEELGWYSTTVRTLDKCPFFVPNALMTDAIIENPGRMSQRKFSETIGVRYQDFDKLQTLITDIKAFLKGHKDIHPDKVMVHFLNFGVYSLQIEISAYTSKTEKSDFYALQEELLLQIGQIVAKSGAEMAYPTNVVLSENLT